MNVKIDTREKFHAITVPGPELSADMAAELADLLLPYLQNVVRSIVLCLKEIKQMDEPAGEILVKTQQRFYEQNASFVVYEMQKPVEEFLDKIHLLEMMNCTPTETEAWDIVQMEEIERELLDG